MMIRLQAVLIMICLSQLRGADGDLPLAAVRNVTTTVIDASDPYLVLGVDFAATLRNSTRADIRVASEPLYPTLIERREETGEWKVLGIPSWYEVGTVKHRECSVVPPGGEFDLPKVRALVTLKKNEKLSHPYVVVRFRLLSVCKQGAKELTYDQAFVTDPVNVEVPR
jgi:hypothetical protein